VSSTPPTGAGHAVSCLSWNRFPPGAAGHRGGLVAGRIPWEAASHPACSARISARNAGPFEPPSHYAARGLAGCLMGGSASALSISSATRMAAATAASKNGLAAAFDGLPVSGIRVDVRHHAPIQNRLSVALVHEARRWCAYPLWFGVYLIRTEIGMPRLVIRLRTAHPILASVF
jgi:hypothetical protein